MSNDYAFCAPFLVNELSEYKELFVQKGKRMTYHSDTILFKTKDRLASIYYIEKGRVRLCTSDYDGKEKIFLLLGEGTIFGGGVTLYPDISFVTAVIESSSVIYAADASIINSSVPFKDSIIKYMSKIILTLMRSIESLCLFCCRTRLYNLLRASVEEKPVEEHWYNLKYQYTQHDMAKIINANRVTIAREINELCNQQLIRIVNRRIQVKL